MTKIHAHTELFFVWGRKRKRWRMDGFAWQYTSPLISIAKTISQNIFIDLLTSVTFKTINKSRKIFSVQTDMHRNTRIKRLQFKNYSMSQGQHPKPISLTHLWKHEVLMHDYQMDSVSTQIICIVLILCFIPLHDTSPSILQISNTLLMYSCLFVCLFVLRQDLTMLPRLVSKSWPQVIFLPWSPECWDYRHTSPCSAFFLRY